MLLDASLDPETLDRVRSIFRAESAVTEVHSLVGRSTDRCGFLVAEMAPRTDDVEKAKGIRMGE